MNWIRTAVTMKGDPSVHAIAAECCKGDIPKAIGHLQCLFSELPAHARDGDLSGVSPLTLEQWALWTGKRGAFDRAVRSHLCTTQVLRSWDKHNGAAIRDNDAARERMKARREAGREAKQQQQQQLDREPTPKRSANGSANGSANVRGTFPSDGTGRDDTEEEEEGAPAPSSSAGHSAEFADDATRSAYQRARRSARNPETFDDVLSSLASGLGAPRGKPLTWHQIGTAILQILGNPTPPPLTANVIAGYATKVPVDAARPALNLFRGDLPGTIRDGDGRIVWHPGMPNDCPGADEIRANGWRVSEAA